MSAERVKKGGKSVLRSVCILPKCILSDEGINRLLFIGIQKNKRDNVQPSIKSSSTATQLNVSERLDEM